MLLLYYRAILFPSLLDPSSVTTRNNHISVLFSIALGETEIWTFLCLACDKAHSSCFSSCCSSLTLSGPRSSPSRCLLKLQKYIHDNSTGITLFHVKNTIIKPLSALQSLEFCPQLWHFLVPTLHTKGRTSSVELHDYSICQVNRIYKL